MTEQRLRRVDLALTATVVVVSVVLYLVLPWSMKVWITPVLSGMVLLKVLVFALLGRRVRTAGGDRPTGLPAES